MNLRLVVVYSPYLSPILMSHKIAPTLRKQLQGKILKKGDLIPVKAKKIESIQVIRKQKTVEGKIVGPEAIYLIKVAYCEPPIGKFTDATQLIITPIPPRPYMRNLVPNVSLSAIEKTLKMLLGEGTLKQSNTPYPHLVEISYETPTAIYKIGFYEKDTKILHTNYDKLANSLR